MCCLVPDAREDGVKTYWAADELLAHPFPPPRWAVEGLLAEGLNIVIGAPKVGKSWLALALGLGVGTGTLALGSIATEPGDVLYLALEDTPRRLQNRLGALLGGRLSAGRLDVATSWETLALDGDEPLHRWCIDHPDARLIIVDTLQKIRGTVNGSNGNAYADDYAAIGKLKAVADRHGVCVVVLHHDRKAESDDFVDRVSGTNGLAGAADAILVLSRSRNTSEATLDVTGRDVEETRLQLQFSSSACTWTLLNRPPDEIGLTVERRAVLAAVKTSPGITPKDLAVALEISHDNAKQIVRRMVGVQQLDTDGQGRYFAPATPLSLVSPESPDLFQSDSKRVFRDSPGDSGDSSDRGTGGQW